VFGYEFGEIADLLDKTPVAVRQITTRAKQRLGRKERRFTPAADRADELAGRFLAACQAGDVHAIEALLAADVVLHSDGGGKAHAAPKPVCGARKVANLLAVVFRKLQRAGTLTVTTVNGRPGAVFTVGGQAVEIVTFAADQGVVGTLYVVLNPDKLRRWPAPPGNERETIRPGPWKEKTDGIETELHGPGSRAD
jgi:RNA polymerase sigma-70 factor (ECF subfamily)